MADAIDFRALVDRAARRVESEDGIAVGSDARAVLVARAEEHEAAVYQALRRENLTERDLENAAVAQLREATTIRRPDAGTAVLGFVRPLPRPIDAAAVQQGMQFKCHWVGWC